MPMGITPTIGVIGGTGLYELDELEGIERVELDTPYGAPSAPYITGTLSGRRMVFLARHGLKHTVLPHELNFRANIWGMKKLGVDQILSVSAVGSMKEAIAPGHMVFVDQFIDRTRMRPSTFYGDGVVCHVSFGDPICKKVQGLMVESAKAEDITHHVDGTYICIEGPQFSTRAESELFRSWGVSVVGMTNVPECRLAREAELRYATAALVTDYDCWHEEEEAVTVEAVMAVLKDNAEKAKRMIKRYATLVPDDLGEDEVTTAARCGLMTPADAISAEARARLAPILDPFIDGSKESSKEQS